MGALSTHARVEAGQPRLQRAEQREGAGMVLGRSQGCGVFTWETRQEWGGQESVLCQIPRGTMAFCG